MYPVNLRLCIYIQIKHSCNYEKTSSFLRCKSFYVKFHLTGKTVSLFTTKQKYLKKRILSRYSDYFSSYNEFHFVIMNYWPYNIDFRSLW